MSHNLTSWLLVKLISSVPSLNFPITKYVSKFKLVINMCYSHSAGKQTYETIFFPEGGVGQTQAWMPAFMLAYYTFPR
jgi:hypothetical protein